MDIKAYYEQLNAREKLLLTIAGVCLGLYLFYSVIYSPINSAVKEKSLVLNDNKQTLSWMEQVYAQNKNVDVPEVLSSDRLLTEISNQLKESDLKNYSHQIEQTSSGDIHLHFVEAPYNEFVKWLWKFCGMHALSVKQFGATPQNAPGVVSVSVLLSQDA